MDNQTQPTAEELPQHALFCSSCRLKYEDLISFKLHLITEFHVYNARRRAANLAPISQILFEQKRKELLSLMSSETSEQVQYCKLCKKKYQSQEQMEQHLKTNKHKQNEKKKKRRGSFSTDDGASSLKKDSEQLSSNADNPFDEEFVEKSLTEASKFEEPRQTAMDSLRICLFCNLPSNGVKKNLDHMRKYHSFFILDIDCLISLKALLHYLAEKIQIGHCCIKCNKNFTNALAAQNHMKDMCHCCMNSDAYDDEYEYFYDFTPTYEENFVGKKLSDFDLSEEPLAAPITKQIFSKVEHEDEKADLQMHPEPMDDIKEDENDNEWEDVDVEDEEDMKTDSVTGSFQKLSAPTSSSFTMIHNDASSTGPEMLRVSEHKEEEIKALAAKSNLSEAEVTKLLERRKKNRFDYHNVNDTYKKAIVLDTGEVKLPTGKIIGHRQWAREYKQKLNLKDAKEQMVVQKLSIEYKKLGATTAVQSFNPNMMFKKYNKAKILHKDKKHELMMGMKHNKIKTQYFKDQNTLWG